MAMVATFFEELLLHERPTALPRLAHAFGTAPATPSSLHTMTAEMESPTWPVRLHDPGIAGAAAMPPRLRRWPRDAAPAFLPQACKLCEASYPSQRELRLHLDHVHGGQQRAREAWLCLERNQPHFVTPGEKRQAIRNFSTAYHYAKPQARHELAAAAAPPLLDAQALFWCAMYQAIARQQPHPPQGAATRPGGAGAMARVAKWEASLRSGVEASPAPAPERRQYVACAFCAVLER